MPAFKFQGKIILIIFRFIRTLLTFEQKVEDKRSENEACGRSGILGSVTILYPYLSVIKSGNKTTSEHLCVSSVGYKFPEERAVSDPVLYFSESLTFLVDSINIC